MSAIWRGTTRPRGAPTRGALALEPPSVHIYYPEKVPYNIKLYTVLNSRDLTTGCARAVRYGCVAV
eukprot:COSAG02_NODE_3511_length_6633_cov_5.316651_8_plen_66_part_00